MSPTTRVVWKLYSALTEAWGKLAPGFPASSARSNVLRTRLLTQSDCRPFELTRDYDAVDHQEINYRNGAAAQTCHDILTADPLDGATVLAGTPGKVDKFVEQMPGDATTTRWDTVVCDEASMIDAGNLALTTGPLASFDFGTSPEDTTAVSNCGRMYLIGDHRQLPVIRKAEWGSIRRPGTERHQPQAPVLDLIRYLHGQEVEFETPVAGGQRGVARDDITYIPLERSYRMHTVIAEHPELGTPVWFIHDAVEGGVGFAHSVYENFEAVAQRALERIEECSCGRDVGCPACLMSSQCGNENEPLHRPAGTSLLRAALEQVRETE